MKGAIAAFLTRSSYLEKVARLAVVLDTAGREEQNGVYDSVAHAWVRALEIDLGLE